jgi:NADH:ubiquinone oxidoreductase subunit 3 (subunit A)
MAVSFKTSSGLLIIVSRKTSISGGLVDGFIIASLYFVIFDAQYYHLYPSAIEFFAQSLPNPP